LYLCSLLYGAEVSSGCSVELPSLRFSLEQRFGSNQILIVSLQPASKKRSKLFKDGSFLRGFYFKKRFGGFQKLHTFATPIETERVF
jgi:hypothetical protein